MSLLQRLTINQNIALIEDNRLYTYEDLKNQIDYSFRQLEMVPSGAVAAIEGDFCFESIAFLIACIEKKIIVAPLEKASEYKLKNACSEYLICERNQKWVIEPQKYKTSHRFINELKKSNHSGLVLFTSGSSGLEKAVIHNCDQLIENLKVPMSPYRTLLFMKFNHIGGLNTLMQILLSNGVIVCQKKRDPDSVCKEIERNQIELLPVTSSFISLMFAMNSHREHSLKSLKITTFGTEPISEYVLNIWDKEMPGVKLLQTYGMTETGILGVKSLRSASNYIKLESDKVLHRIRNGMLEIKMPSSMMGYLNSDEYSLEDGWFFTGDKVEVSGEHFKILGRESDWIIVGGQKVSPFEVEDTLSLFPGVMSAKVFGRDFMLTHQIVVAKIFCEPSKQNEEFIQAVKEFCKEKMEYYKVPMEIEFYNPLDNGEIKKKRNEYSSEPI